MKLTHTLMAAGVVVAVVVAPARAQVPAKGLFLGPWAGANFATVAVTDFPSGFTFPTRSAFAVGLQLERELGNAVFFRVGGFYSGRGSKVDVSGPGGGTGTVSLDYVEFPIVFGFRLARPRSHFAPYVTLGGQTALDTVQPVSSTTTCSSFLGGSSISSTDFGLTAGVGFDYSTGGRTLMVDARYLDGLSNVITDSSPTIKNRGITVAIGYMFPIAR